MNTDSFALRHIGVRETDVHEMIQTIGVDSLDQLIEETVPKDIYLNSPLELPKAISEFDFLALTQRLGEKNKIFKSYIGMGYHPSIMPPVIQRNIFENPGWYTAYTPYQAEIAQGRLEALLNFQTMVTDLTGMEIANASLLDEATAAAEAMSMLYELRSREQKQAHSCKFFVDNGVFPQTLNVLKTRSTPQGIELVEGSFNEINLTTDYYAVLLQYPAKNGHIEDYRAFINQCRDKGIRVVMAADILSLVLLESPGALGADVAVGNTQRFGIPMGYGGPHAAYFATKEEFKRQLPGRIIGVTRDANEDFALRMALQTREQHIKRDKATSNICTAQVFLAVMAGMYAVYHGPDGLRYIAKKIHGMTDTLAQGLSQMGIKRENSEYFDTLTVEIDAKKLRPIAEKYLVNFYYPSDNQVVLSLNETTSPNDLSMLLEIFAETVNHKNVPKFTSWEGQNLSSTLLRKSEFLVHDIFNRYHSETALMRYIKKLERKDLSLTHSMISLGSCTMKLNAAAEMLPLSLSYWSNIHPFAPLNQVEGYSEMISSLEKMLSTITGFAATSIQPNSGAQGEYAGLMVIRAFHQSRGEGHRNICLIPASAHGTNPASAVMAGMKVIVTKTDERGNIDLEDLKSKAIQHSDELAALMITYPSTHGVFESSIREITQLIHDHGGQVYMDGANMNAQVGITNPARIGADVCHLNLHKTFSIPHGGGGPGVGPICVASHLAPFLPNHPIIPTGGSVAITGISAAPWGSALVCLISYGYIRMLGADGLKKATIYAILNANYLASRLSPHFEILYKGEKGRSAHEFIIDCRPFKKWGVEVVDIAKRLMDYGFHAPTVSFPVPGTMMIEPTESESLEELNKFCDAMISIRQEIVECSELLHNAPHTLEMITSDYWAFSYSRERAAFPMEYLRENKFWPSVRRVDEAFGDRNLMCTCPPTELYAEMS